jgi:hypothetical protein
VIALINDDVATFERWWPPRRIVPAEKGKAMPRLADGHR